MTTFQKSLIQRLASRKTKKQNGFTLIELMVVVAIVGVLTAVGLPQLSKAQDNAKDSAAKSTLTNAAKECSLELLSGAASYDITTNPNFADVTGDCEPGSTLKLFSESGDGETTEYKVEFVGAVPSPVEDA